MELETEKRLIKMIAKDIDTIVAREKCVKWFLAAGEKINRPIIDKLRPDVKTKLDKNITADLTKTYKSEILKFFP